MEQTASLLNVQCDGWSSLGYNDIITRISDILKADEELYKIIQDWGTVDLPEQKDALNYPALYVTHADPHQVKRTHIGTAGKPNMITHDLLEYDFWIIIVASKFDSQSTQNEFFGIYDHVERILGSNVQLAKPDTINKDTGIGEDPLVSRLTIARTPRLTGQRGTLVDGLNIVITVSDANF